MLISYLRKITLPKRHLPKLFILQFWFILNVQICVCFVTFNITNVLLSNIRKKFSCIQSRIRNINFFTIQFILETDWFEILNFLYILIYGIAELKTPNFEISLAVISEYRKFRLITGKCCNV